MEKDFKDVVVKNLKFLHTLLNKIEERKQEIEQLKEELKEKKEKLDKALDFYNKTINYLTIFNIQLPSIWLHSDGDKEHLVISGDYHIDKVKEEIEALLLQMEEVKVDE